MQQCLQCNFIAKNKAGLFAHSRRHGMGESATDDSATPMTSAPAHSGSCPDCDMLPAGSVKITSLFLVMVFCLCAVLFTAFYQIQLQRGQIIDLQSQLAHYEK